MNGRVPNHPNLVTSGVSIINLSPYLYTNRTGLFCVFNSDLFVCLLMLSHLRSSIDETNGMESACTFFFRSKKKKMALMSMQNVFPFWRLQYAQKWTQELH
jgi:hypothetical protein